MLVNVSVCPFFFFFKCSNEVISGLPKSMVILQVMSIGMVGVSLVH